MPQSRLIPLRNVWLLFLYAADLVEFRAKFEGEIESASDLPELLGRLLSHVVEERLRRSLSRAYRPHSAVLSRVRGRIDALKTESRQLLGRGQVACRFEYYTVNTARNRLVRAALNQLAACISEPNVAHRCRVLSSDISRFDVGACRPSQIELAMDQIGRNETADRLMVSLARMVFDVVIPTEAEGENELHVTTPSEPLLRRLFERAVGNALRFKLTPLGWTVVQGRRLRWPSTTASPGIKSILPGMQTDIELRYGTDSRRIVIDTKFTSIFTNSNFREGMLKSGYLYQIYAYLRTQERLNELSSLTSEGMLLHPQIGGAVDETMYVQGHMLRFKTIDLMAPSSDFENSLLNIL